MAAVAAARDARLAAAPRTHVDVRRALLRAQRHSPIQHPAMASQRVGEFMHRRAHLEERYTALRARYWLVRSMCYEGRRANALGAAHGCAALAVLDAAEVRIAYTDAAAALHALRQLELELSTEIGLLIGGAREAEVPPAMLAASADSLRTAGVPLGNE
jgi:hypothetical protein